MKNRRQNIILALVISLLLHFILVGLGLYISGLKIRPPQKEEVMEVDLQTDQEWKIADIAPPKKEVRPKKAKHIGVHDSTVKEETVATTTPRAPGRPETRGGEGMENIKKKFDPTENTFEKREVIRLPKEKMRASKDFRVMPEDYYPDYKRGPHTYINVLKHMDAGYFVRLKRVFKLAWDPSPALRSHMMTGEVSRGKIRVVLGITIGNSGGLDELFVINSSGLKAYDREAMRAVRASAPFSAPPSKFLAKDKTLRISWSFVVYL